MKQNGDKTKCLIKALGNYSYNDLRSELQSIIQQKYGKKSQDGNYWMDYPYIVDVYEDEFVVEKDGKYYIAEYKCDKDNSVIVGDFYDAKKSYKQIGKQPVKKMGKNRPNDAGEVKVSY
jgi:hypothetical protein